MNDVPAAMGRAVIVLCAYRGAAKPITPSPLSGWRGKIADLVTLRYLREFVAMWRDFYANLRSPSYQRALAEAVATRCAAGSPVLVDTALAEEAVPSIPSAEIARRDLAGLRPAELPASEAIVLIYPDPLGLSWGGLEKQALATGRPVYILNGRRRLFHLDAAARRALALRRFLANTRLVELVAGVVLIPVAGALALRDRLAGRT